MKINFYTKSFLSVYKHLKPLTLYIDKVIDGKVSNSFYDRGDLQKTAGTIIDLSQKKLLFVNLKIILNKIFLNINKDSAKMLILKYVDCLPGDKLKEIFALQERTMYRRLKIAVEEFDAELAKAYKEYPKVLIEAINDSWINSLAKNIAEKEGKSSAVDLNILYSKNPPNEKQKQEILSVIN